MAATLDTESMLQDYPDETSQKFRANNTLDFSKVIYFDLEKINKQLGRSNLVSSSVSTHPPGHSSGHSHSHVMADPPGHIVAVLE